MVAGIASGNLSDKYGRMKLMKRSVAVSRGLYLGTFMTDIKWAFIFLPLFGLGGSIVLTLPYAILIRLMPKEHIGQFTGMFSMMRGLANIDRAHRGRRCDRHRGKDLPPRFHEGREYAAIWLVSAIMILISLFFFRGKAMTRWSTFRRCGGRA